MPPTPHQASVIQASREDCPTSHSTPGPSVTIDSPFVGRSWHCDKVLLRGAGTHKLPGLYCLFVPYLATCPCFSSAPEIYSPQMNKKSHTRAYSGRERMESEDMYTIQEVLCDCCGAGETNINVGLQQKPLHVMTTPDHCHPPPLPLCFLTPQCNPIFTSIFPCIIERPSQENEQLEENPSCHKGCGHCCLY